MPFQSKAQQRWAFATKQPFAKEWAGMTDEKRLPAYKNPKKRHVLRDVYGHKRAK
jgi:hypothetical protein